jgi:hypothetical protein
LKIIKSLQVEEFVRDTTSNYRLKMVRKSGPIKQALAEILEEHPELMACLLGTRKADPGAQCLEAFAPTDPGWPEIVRVSPIINWNYRQVLLSSSSSFSSSSSSSSILPLGYISKLPSVSTGFLGFNSKRIACAIQ